MVRLYCKLCLLSVPATDWTAHISQKQHLQQLPCKLVVKGSFDTDKSDQVYEYFARFGGIRGQNVGLKDGKTTIEYRFWDARIYSEVIHQEHVLFDDTLNISWWKKSKAGALEHVIQDEKMCNERFVYQKLDIINTTKDLPTFPEQTTALFDKLKTIRTNFHENRKLINDDLIKALSSHFKHNQLHFFGSAITYLDLHDSDLNIYLDNSNSSLELITDLITKSANFAIRSTQSHCLKFTHLSTKTPCELNIKNEIPVGNSELVKFYLTLDNKLREFVLLIKFWSDCHDLRKGASFSSYAIYLLAIFYLQQEPYKLPSVADLQTEAPPDEIDGWNCAFGPVEFSNSAIAGATTSELLEGFFRFYGSFNYLTYVVSPYLGAPIEKTRFAERQLPECFRNYKDQEKDLVVNSGFCIQDPFEHASNLAIDVCLNSAGKLADACRNSARLLKKGSKDLLYSLLIQDCDDSVEFGLPRNNAPIKDIKTMTSRILGGVFACQVEEVENSYVCEGRYNIWDNRLNYDLEKEIALTASLVESSTPEVLWKMSLEIGFGPSEVTFSFKDGECLAHIAHFFYIQMRKFLEEGDFRADSPLPVKVEAPPPVKVETEDDVIFVGTGVKSEVYVVDSDSEDEVKPEVKSEPVPVFEVKSDPNQVIPMEPVGTTAEDTDEPGIHHFDLRDHASLKVELLTKLEEVSDFDQQLMTASDFLVSYKPRRFYDKIRLHFKQILPTTSKIVFLPMGSNLIKVSNRSSSTDIYVDMKDSELPLERLKYLLENSSVFSRPSVDYEKRIIKCIHTCPGTAIRTDFSLHFINNEFVHTSMFLTKLLRKHANLRKGIIILKFWLDCTSEERFSTYVVCLLVIFYLQQSPHNLAAVERFQRGVDRKVNAAWNCAFHNPQDENQDEKVPEITMPELLKGFFSFYSDFDYSKYVISPYFGAPIEKQRFLKPYDLPVNVYKEYIAKEALLSVGPGLCIQDLFDHSRNVAEGVRGDQLGTLCKSALRIVTSSKKDKLTKLLNRAIQMEEDAKVESENNQMEAASKEVTESGSENVEEEVIKLQAENPCETVSNKIEHEVGHSSGEPSVTESGSGHSEEVTKLQAENPFEIISKETEHEVKHCSGEPAVAESGSGHLEEDVIKVQAENPFETALKVEHSSGEPAVTESGRGHLEQEVAKLQAENPFETISKDLNTITSASVGYFGSRTTNLHLPSSDLNAYVLSEPNTVLSSLRDSTAFTETSLIGTYIRSKHAATEVWCNLNTTHDMIVSTSALVDYYFSLNPKLRILVVVLKFWLRSYFPNKEKFSSYSLYLMVIFYLQHPPYNLPSVFDLQKDITFLAKDAWNCVFEPVEFTSDLLESATPEELLKGFFDFYAKFDYISKVISPFSGRGVDKICFLKPYDLPSCFCLWQYTHLKEDLALDSGLCIQDPFRHTENVSAGLSTIIAGRFVSMCNVASDICAKAAKELLFSSLLDLQLYRNYGFTLLQPIQSRVVFVATTIIVLKKIFGCRFVAKEEDTSICFTCAGDVHILDEFDRVRIAKKLWKRQLSEIENEIAITEHLTRNCIGYGWQMSFSVNFESGPDSVRVVSHGEPTSLHLFNFLHLKLEKLLAEETIRDNIQLEILEAEDLKVDSTKWYTDDTNRDISKTVDPTIDWHQDNFRRSLRLYFTKNFKDDSEFREDHIRRLQMDLLKNRSDDVVVRDLKDLICGKWPRTEITLYGSTSMNLDFPNSDLNLCIKFAPADKQLVDLITGNDKFVDVALVSANVLLCIHAPTRTLCQLNLGYESEVSTTQVLIPYLFANRKVHDLVMVLKLWVFCYCSQWERFPSYALYLMVIFYLQQPPNDWPSGEYVQKKSVPPKLQEAMEKKRLRYLLLGFFKFYGNFDYITYVVAPFRGRAIEKHQFLKCCKSLHSGLCIQDMSDLSKNVTENMSLQAAGRFASLCRAAQYCMEVGSNPMIDLVTRFTDFSRGFKIENVSKIEDWNLKVHRALSKILWQALGCKVFRNRKAKSAYKPYKCSEMTDIWETRVSVLKNVWKPDSALIDNEVEATKRATSKKPGTLEVSVCFSKNYCKIKGNNDPFHYMHYVYTRLRMLLGLDNIQDFVTSSSLSDIVELKAHDVLRLPLIKKKFYKRVEEEFKASPTFDRQVSVLENARSPTNFDGISQDLVSLLGPQTKILFYGSRVSRIELPHSDLNVFIQTPSELPSVSSAMSRSRRFDCVSQSGNTIDCVHVRTRLWCRLKSTDNITQADTSLTNYYISFDDKVRTLMLIAKFWCENSETPLFTSHVVTLLVIFYLQQPPYGLPAVKDVPATFTSEPLQSATIEDLLAGFFKFYGDFDYISFVISPYAGAPVAKVGFLEPYDLPQCYQPISFNLNTGLCVQDPFDHSNNLTESVSLGDAGLFAASCRSAFRVVSDGQGNILSRLLNREPEDISTFALIKSEVPSGVDVGETFITVLKQVLFLYWTSVRPGSESSSMIYDCRRNKRNIWRQRINAMKNVWKSDLDDLSNEIAVSRSVTGRSKLMPRFRIEVDSELKWCKITGGPSSFHYIHFLHTRFEKFLTKKAVQHLEMEIDNTVPMEIDEEDTNEPISVERFEIDQPKDDFLGQIRALIASNSSQGDLSAISEELSVRLGEISNKICFYGSRPLGLALEHSDLNVYVEVKEQYRESPPETLQLIAKSLSGLYTDVEIGDGVKCLHAKTNIVCVLKITGQHLVKSSELIQNYLKVHDSMDHFFFYIKLWFRRHWLPFPSYSIYLLIIFYLQQEPYELRKSRNAFLHSATLEELIKGFFDFYAAFDYISCRILGSPVAKTTIGMCIQDPLRPGVNVVASLPDAVPGKFAALCRSARTGKTLEELFDPCPDYPRLVLEPESKDLLLKILREILGCKVTENADTYQCTDEDKLKLTSQAPDLTVWDREVLLVSHLPEGFRSMTVKVICKEKLVVEVISDSGLVFHQYHYLYTRLLKFAGTEPTVFGAKFRASVVEAVKDGKDFDEQVAILQDELQKCRALRDKNYAIISKDLESIFQNAYENYKISTFASNWTGLNNISELVLYATSIPSRKLQPSADFVFTDDKPGTVVKMSHISTRTRCVLTTQESDLKIKQLIESYFGLNEKLSAFMMVLEFWICCCNLTDFFYGDALYLMAIFYLQEEPHILATVMNLNDPTAPHISASVSDLLTRFFKFYADFDFRARQVSTYSGAKRNPSPLFIENPFKRSQNVWNGFQEHIPEFTVCCKTSLRVLTEDASLHRLLLECQEWELQNHSDQATSLEVSQPETEPYKVMNKDTYRMLQSSLTTKLEFKSFTDQVRSLRNQLLLPRRTVENNCAIIKKDLSAALIGLFPQHQVIFCGSVTTNTHLHGSEVDVYVSNVKQPSNSDMSQLVRMKDLIIQFGKFTSVTLNPGTKIKVPVIRCVHKDTQMTCELNIKDKLMEESTKLVDSYLSLDDKFEQLVFVIKFWVDRYEMNEAALFYTYVVKLMVIFYLQRPPYRLKPVVDLQKGVSDIVDGWNCAFALPESTGPLRAASVQNLVKGFFEFYGSFDYFSSVISPFFGAPIAKTRFLQPCNLPPAYQNYTNRRQVLDVNTAICVQDPFEHSKNVATAVLLSNVGKFAALCRLAARVIDRGEEVLLHKLVTLSPQDPKYGEFVIDGLDPKWSETVKKITTKTLTEVAGCKITRSDLQNGRFSYDCEGPLVILKNRAGNLKSLLKQFTSRCTEMEKEVAVSAYILKRYTESTSVQFSIEVGYSPCAITVRLKSDTDLSFYILFLYTRLRKFLTDREIEKVAKSEPALPATPTTVDEAPPTTPEKPQVAAAANLNKIKNIAYHPSMVLKKKANQAVLKTIRAQSDFQEQVAAFAKAVLCSEFLDKREAAVKEIGDVLAKAFTYTKISVYGSAVTGIHLNGGIVDLHIEGLKLRDQDKEATMEQLMEVVRAYENCTKICFVYGNDGATTIEFRNRLQRCSYSLSMSSKQSVYSSDLIRYYLSLDRKVSHLTLIVKYYLDFNGLRKKDVFTNYAVYLLVIFYLQQQPYNLPSVHSLQQGVTEMVDGWNMAFTPIEIQIQKLEQATVFDLVVGFFKFYRDFDYTSFVVSPFFGSPIAKIRFLHPCDLPDSFHNLTDRKQGLPVSSRFCIQDPFVHAKNVGYLDVQSVGKFTALCRSLVEMSEKGETMFLHKVLTNKVVDYAFQFMFEKKEEISEPDWVRYVKMALQTVLTNIMCCKITYISEVEKNQEIFLVVTYKFGGERNFWDDRIHILKGLLPRLAPNINEVDKESVISWTLMNNSRKSVPAYSFTALVSFRRHPWFVKISGFTKQHRQHIVQFFYLQLRKALEPYVKSTNGDSSQDDALASVVCEPYKIRFKGTFNKQEVDEIERHFDRFGASVSKSIAPGDTGIRLEYIFHNVNAYCRVIQEVHVLSNQKLKLVPLAPLLAKIPNAKFKDPRLDTIFSLVEPTLDRQVDILEKKLEVDKSGVETRRKSITEDFKSALIRHFPRLRVHFFGLDFQGCALSVYVDNVRSGGVPELETLESIKCLLMRSNNFSEVCVVTAQVPFMKCKHSPTQTAFDITIRNKLPVRSCDLVKYYLSLDDKIPTMVTIVKFWADSYDLVGRDGFSFYSLCLLIIFYLQHEPYKLPSLTDLQRNTTPDIVEGWNCAYAESVDFASPSLRTMPLSELVKGFFVFYANFDYVSYVISPFSGAAIEKTRFIKPYDLPEDFRQYLVLNDDLYVDAGLCIQDLFQHASNVASSASLDFAGYFTSLCRCALQLFQRGENQLLHKLFLHCQNEALVEFPAFVILKSDVRNDPDWIQLVKARSTYILTEILKCRLSQMATFRLTSSVSYACVGQYDVWKDRIDVAKTVSGLSDMEKEVAVTARLVNEREAGVSCNVVVDLTFMRNPCRVKVNFVKKSGGFSLYHMCHFFYTRLDRFLAEEGEKAANDAEAIETVLPPETSNLAGSSIVEPTPITTSSGSSSVLIQIIPAEGDQGKEEVQQRKRQRSKPPEEGEITDDDDDEDGVPSDFFDDFADDNFLEGLDIVDAWNNDTEPPKQPARRRPRRSRSGSRTKRRRRSTSKLRDRREARRRSRTPKCRKRRRSVGRGRSRSRPRSRSESPLRKAQRKSFLEEIQEKLNEVRPASSQPPTFYNLPSYNNFIYPPAPPAPASSIRDCVDGAVPAPVAPPPAPVPPSVPPPKQKQDGLEKLFAEKKISLSDFLTLKAKFTATRKSVAVTDHALRKVKLFARCQEILNFMTETGNPSGPLVVKPSPINKSESKFVSPLRRLLTVRFGFTTHRLFEDGDSFTRSLNQILRKVGLKEISVKDDVEDLVDVVTRTVRQSEDVDKDKVTEILKVALWGVKAGTLKPRVSIGSQCEDPGETCSVGVQVEDDLRSRIREAGGNGRPGPSHGERRSVFSRLGKGPSERGRFYDRGGSRR